jgi:hypothetical protein
MADARTHVFVVPAEVTRSVIPAEAGIQRLCGNHAGGCR